MRDDIATLLRDAAADPSHTPDFDALAARGRRQHLTARAGTALVAVVALVAGGLVLWPDGQPTNGPVIGDGPPTRAESQQPVVLPDGWHEVRVADAVLGVPADWTLDEFDAPAPTCIGGRDEPTAVVLHAGPAPTLCTAEAVHARVLQAAPLSQMPPEALEAGEFARWQPVTTVGNHEGEMLKRNKTGNVVDYQFPSLDLWLQFAAPGPIETWPDEILATLSSNSESAPTGRATPATGVETFTGAAHCGWESVEFIRLPKDIIPVRYPGDQWVTFARDTEEALSDGMVDGTYRADVALPSAAMNTGVTTEYGTVWLVPDENEAIYVVQVDGSVQKWPASSAGCD